jgi:hypothetical protein
VGSSEWHCPCLSETAEEDMDNLGGFRTPNHTHRPAGSPEAPPITAAVVMEYPLEYQAVKLQTGSIL